MEADQGTWTWRHDRRLQTVDNSLLLANRKATRPDPLDARSGDELEHGLVMKQRLGKGTTALALLVERDGREHVLRVAVSPDQDDRLHAEADVMRRLRHQYIVELRSRFKPSGLRKREAWKHTWALQRIEDAIDARVALPAEEPERLTPEAATALKAAEVGVVPAPPRYAAADSRKGGWWHRRGKLDVSKERFVSLPGCERDADPSLVVAWWNALEQSRAVAGYFSRMREQEGRTAERLAPLLAALLELLPWVRQYHNAPDPEFDIGMGDYFEAFIDDEARALSLTFESLRDWAPAGGAAGRGRRRRAT